MYRLCTIFWLADHAPNTEELNCALVHLRRADAHLWIGQDAGQTVRQHPQRADEEGQRQPALLLEGGLGGGAKKG